MHRIEKMIVGPLPPPVGGVSESVRKAIVVLNKISSERVTVFNTSSGRVSEDLYARKGIGSYFSSLILIMKFFRALVRLRPREVHAFVTSNSAFLRDIPLILLARVFSSRLIIHLHSKTEGEMFLRGYLIRWMFLVLGVADRILVLSDKHLEYFSKYVRDQKLAVLENFCLSTEFESSSKNASKFLYCGRLSKRKGFFDLLEAVSMLDNDLDISVSVLGVADNESSEKLIRTTSIQLDGQFCFKGVVVGDEKLKEFSNSKCLIFPSHFENSPVTLKEAMQANLLIIASDIEPNQQVLREYPGAIFFDVGSPYSLSLALARVCRIERDELECIMEECSQCIKFDEEYAENVLTSI